MYLYETHLHTAPASGCARWSAAEAVRYYKNAGYAGIFITNHFLDDDIPEIRALPYAEQIQLYFSDFEDGRQAGREVGLSVFSGVEISYLKTDFLIYGLDKAWYLDHPEIDRMPVKDFLALAQQEGALVIHAHPFREAGSIDHIRLYPRSVHGVEVYNANRSEFENEMAAKYAKITVCSPSPALIFTARSSAATAAVCAANLPSLTSRTSSKKSWQDG